MLNSEVMTARIVDWIRCYVVGVGARGLVVGLSGGIDSAVIAGLASRAFPRDCLGVIMPCHSQDVDAKYAELVADRFSMPVKKVVLDEVYDAFMETAGEEDTAMSKANVKPRLRMLTLYYLASAKGYLVAGTGNRSELEVGYFTKYGDGGVDFEPIGHLVKTEVREIARYLGVPDEIINRQPTAGLWAGQTDEQEMGITYEQLDQYLLTGVGSEVVKTRVEELRRRSEHKRQLPPVPNFD